MSNLYRIAKSFNSFMLPVSGIHTLYVEEFGNPEGIPIVHLHGGPGGYTRPRNTKFYNPDKYRIILFDQRGCGKSTPLGEVNENTTSDLISDMEKIREHLGIDKWMLSGGSWGATLALYYAENHPERVRALLLRGLFTASKFELNWLQKEGACYFFPEEWERYKNFIPPEEQDNLPLAYAKRILGPDRNAAVRAAKNADQWAMSIGTLNPPVFNPNYQITEMDFACMRVFFHYETNNSFLGENEIIENAYKLENVPGVIIAGRYDMICPPVSAWRLHQKWPKSKLEFVLSGHHYSTPAMWKKILEYSDIFSNQL